MKLAGEFLSLLHTLLAAAADKQGRWKRGGRKRIELFEDKERLYQTYLYSASSLEMFAILFPIKYIGKDIVDWINFFHQLLVISLLKKYSISILLK